MQVYAADEIQFNTDVLDTNDRNNIDLSQFSRSGFIMPGTYTMVLHVNKSDMPEHPVAFVAPENDPKGSEVCLSPALVNQLGLKENQTSTLAWTHGGQCLDLHSLPGMEAHGDLSTSSLYLSIPQAYLEYTSENWDPPSRWDEGIPGLLFDYNVNAQTQQRHRSGGSGSYSLSGNGTTGANLGAWRLRADWQANLSHQTGSGQPTDSQFDWSRYYAYRAIPALRARMSMGEDYLSSDLFDSLRFTGASLRSDDNMLPPNLRGYAPEVSGVAKTNAKVVISQQGRVLYETQVAAGPFRIQDINDAVSGELDVRVEEQDGSVQTFKMNTASIPYLTRPGSLRYKLAMGKPSDWEHRTRGPLFATGEFSWGVSNGWSLYGGGIGGGDYNALSVGLGRDLMALGALSFDVTQSRADLPQQGTLTGGSYRLSYSKNFDEYDSQITFAGYRFSQKDFMSMAEYLDARYEGERSGNSKELYTITFNKQFRDWGLSTYLTYSHQTYWDRAANDRYNLMVSRYFDVGNFKNLSVSLSAYRTRYNDTNDDGMYLSLSVPWGNSGTLSYNMAASRDDNTHRIGYYDRVDEHNNYQISAGSARSGATASGYYSHEGDMAQISANASYQGGSYSAMGLTAQGGITMTPQGAALHRVTSQGGTRLMLDTEGVADVPVRGYGSTIMTNRFGKAVITDVNSYYRNKASIDLNRLGDNVEATRSVVQATLTEGAIGYRQFDVIAGEKAMAIIKLADGSEPPFGATVMNMRKQTTGIINDGGTVYLSGINPGEVMQVHWNGGPQCQVQMPTPLPAEMLMNSLLLPCQPLDSAKTPAAVAAKEQQQ
ncbi:fimbrial assembly protein [Gibbsiella quercinecans]|nr:fimbrial assembly protein [Gibbsiella quercinecans]